MRVLFKSNNLIGDAMYISPAWREWLHKQGCDITDEIFMLTLPDHVAPLYQGMVRDIVNIKTVFERPEGEFKFEHVFDVNKAFKISDTRQQHVAESYADDLGITLPGERKRPGEYDPRLKPTFIPDEHNKYMEGPHQTLGSLKDCILISAFSASCTSRDPTIGTANKMLLWAKWKPILNYLRQTFPSTSIRFLGAPTDFIPDGYEEGIVQPGEYMLGIPLNRLALIMRNAKLVVTIDNGMSHLAASQEANTFLMYPQCLGIHYILPVGNPNLSWVQMNPLYVNPAQLLFGLKKAVERFKLV